MNLFLRLCPLLFCPTLVLAIPPEQGVLTERARVLQQSASNLTGAVLVVGASGGGELSHFSRRGFQVLGVECLPREYARLHELFIRDPCVTIINGCGAGSFGLRTLHLSGDSSSFTEAFAKPPHNHNAEEWRKARLEARSDIKVLTLRLDPVVASYGKQIAIVWVDVQGAEYELFLGLARTFETHRPIVLYEFYFDLTHRARALLEMRGYTCAQYNKAEMMCTPDAAAARQAFAAAPPVPRCTPPVEGGAARGAGQLPRGRGFAHPRAFPVGRGRGVGRRLLQLTPTRSSSVPSVVPSSSSAAATVASLAPLAPRGRRLARLGGGTSPVWSWNNGGEPTAGAAASPASALQPPADDAAAAADECADGGDGSADGLNPVTWQLGALRDSAATARLSRLEAARRRLHVRVSPSQRDSHEPTLACGRLSRCAVRRAALTRALRVRFSLCRGTGTCRCGRCP